MSVRYEWTVEHLDGNGDIIASDFSDRLGAHLARFAHAGSGEAAETLIGLVKNYHDRDTDDLVDRTWAYVDDGILPVAFQDGSAVPKRFRAEAMGWR